MFFQLHAIHPINIVFGPQSLPTEHARQVFSSQDTTHSGCIPAMDFVELMKKIRGFRMSDHVQEHLLSVSDGWMGEWGIHYVHLWKLLMRSFSEVELDNELGRLQDDHVTIILKPLIVQHVNSNYFVDSYKAILSFSPSTLPLTGCWRFSWSSSELRIFQGLQPVPRQPGYFGEGCKECNRWRLTQEGYSRYVVWRGNNLHAVSI